MKTNSLLLPLVLLLSVLPLRSHSLDQPIDFEKAQQIVERHQRGETVTAEEEAYVKRAMAERQRQQGAGSPPAATSATGAGDIDMEKARAIFQRRKDGEKLPPEDEAYL